MKPQFNDARLSVEKAREALRNGNRTEARQWAEHAASLAPQMEDPWLILAAVASPRASVEYIQTALKINPDSPRARKGLEWATERLRTSSQQVAPQKSESIKEETSPSKGAKKSEGSSSLKRGPLFALLLLVAGCILCIVAAWSASSSPVWASLMNMPAPTQAHSQVWAQVEISKPTYTPLSPAESLATPTPQYLLQATIQPTEVALALPTETLIPLQAPTDTPMPTPQDTESAPTVTPMYSGSISMAIVPDTPAAAGATTMSLPTPASTLAPQIAGSGERWIDVNLTQQMVYAYQGNTVVNSFLVSTGTWQYPTVTGQYHIYIKLRYTDMSGPGYYLPNVPFTMYFYKGYGLHGTYWHHNFGTPMSHGCVNLSIPDSEWLYNWASVGTLVNIHY
jgi:lipoprotein-anchoring transpeptidase ErfK/SrfK